MDPEVKELKEMVRHSIAVAEDTNRQVHKIRSASRWSLVFTILWWLSIIGLTGAVYYYVLAPYLEQFMPIFGAAQEALQNFRPGP